MTSNVPTVRPQPSRPSMFASVALAAACATALQWGVQAQQPPASQPPAAQAAPAPPPPVPAPAVAPTIVTNDPRVGLKPGLKDAGKAQKNMELIATLFKPEGFYDPKQPAGTATPPEEPPKPAEEKKPETPATPPAEGTPAAAAGHEGHQMAGATPAEGAAPATPVAETPKPEEKKPPTPEEIRRSNMLNFANSDLAFKGQHLFVGSFHGFNSYGIENAKRPKLIASIVCPGGQGDVSVRGNLLFMSVEQTRGRLDCGVQGIQEPVSKERFRGVRIFDISDLNHPRQVAAVQTCRGSHTHTLVTNPGTPDKLYVYGSGTGQVRPGEELDGCSDKDPKDDPNTALFSIDVIEVPLAAPEQAKIVNRPRIFADKDSGAISGLWQGGNHGPGTQSTRLTNQCHDITVFPEVGLAAGACSGNGILMDISDPVNPVRLDHVVDPNFAYWHSATFNNDGTKVVFTDEWGGGTRPRCRATDPPTWGANAIFDIVDRKLQFRGYYKLPAPQSEQENCVAHNGSIIPVPGRDIMVQAWYQGGVSVYDFSDSTRPVEIAYFDRGPVDAKSLITGGYWSAYWYNGNIYGAEISRGIDVFRLKPSDMLSENELDAALMLRAQEFNAQEQRMYKWPPSTLVAMAYLDQLARTNGLAADRRKEVEKALERADKIRTGKEKQAPDTIAQLESIATQLESDAAAATSTVDARRLRLLATNLKDRSARLRGTQS